jgi:hypothetical protein
LPALKTAGGVRLFDRRDVERLALERVEQSTVAPTAETTEPATR